MSDLTRFIADLSRVGARTVPVARLALERAALAEKRQMARNFEGSARYRSLPKAVDYDIRGLSAEVGVNQAKRQGSLGNIIAYGTATSPAVVDHAAGFDAVSRDFERDLGDAVEGLFT